MVKCAKASEMCTITAETTLLLLLVAVHIATYLSEKNVHGNSSFAISLMVNLLTLNNVDL